MINRENGENAPFTLDTWQRWSFATLSAQNERTCSLAYRTTSLTSASVLFYFWRCFAWDLWVNTYLRMQSLVFLVPCDTTQRWTSGKGTFIYCCFHASSGARWHVVTKAKMMMIKKNEKEECTSLYTHVALVYNACVHLYEVVA